MELSGQLHAFATLPPGTKSQYQLNRRLDGLQSYTGHFGDKKNLRNHIPHHPAHSLVTIRTTLEVLDDGEYW